MAEPRFDVYEKDVCFERRREGLDRKLAEEIYFKEVRPRLIKAEMVRKKQRPDQLYRAGLELGVDVEDVFADVALKREALKRFMRFRNLRICAGKGASAFVSVDGAKDDRVGEVYKKCFYQGEKILKEQ